MNFSSSAVEDIPQLTEWIQNDPYHFHLGQPEWWLTGATDSLLAFCLMDDRGPLTYVRLDSEGEYVRIHTQFAPESIVSKRRLITGMIVAIDKLIEIFQSSKKGLIFNSVSPALVAFMDRKFGFKYVGDDDYRLDFEEGN